MSKSKRKLSDYFQYMKPLHLAGQQHTLTITHIGGVVLRSREREYIVAGEAPEEQPTDYQLILHFREFSKPLRVNATNLDFLLSEVGDDPDALPGCKITIRPVTLKKFGGVEMIEIVAVTKGETPKPVIKDRGRLKYLINKQVEIARKKGFEAIVPTDADIAAMNETQVSQAIEKAESNILDLQAATQ